MSERKTAKPEIEEVIGGVITGEVLNNALKLIAYLREKKMNPRWSATNVWKVSYNGFSVCFIRVYGAAEYHGLGQGCWHIIPFIGEYPSDLISDEFKEIVWANQMTCGECGKCALELNHVFGRTYDYVCEKSIVFNNPDSGGVECVKKLLELRKNAIKEGKARKHKYIAMKNR